MSVNAPFSSSELVRNSSDESEYKNCLKIILGYLRTIENPTAVLEVLIGIVCRLEVEVIHREENCDLTPILFTHREENHILTLEIQEYLLKNLKTVDGGNLLKLMESVYQMFLSESAFETRLRILRIFLIPVVAGSRIVSLIKFYSANISRILESLVDSPILEGFEDGKKNVLVTRYTE